MRGTFKSLSGPFFLILALLGGVGLALQDTHAQAAPAAPAKAAPPAAPAKAATPSPLQIIALYPPKDVPLGQQVVLYFNESLLETYEPLEDFPLPARTTPVGMLAGAAISENHLTITLNSPREFPGLPCVVLDLSPNLRAAKTAQLPSKTQRLILPLTPPNNTLQRIVGEEDHLRLEVSTPLPAPLWQQFYTVQVVDTANTPLEVPWTPMENDTTVLSGPLPLTAPLPISVHFTRNTRTAGLFAPFLPPSIILAPEVILLSLSGLSWKKSSSKDTLVATFSDDISAATAASHVTFLCEEKNIPLEAVPGDADTNQLTFKMDSTALGAAAKGALVISPPLFGNNGGVLLAEQRQDVASEQVEDDSGDGDANSSLLDINGGEYWQEEGVKGARLSFWTNAALDPDAVKEKLTIKPPVENLQIERRERGFTLCGDWHAEQAYTITIANGLKSVDAKKVLNHEHTINTEKAPRVSGAGFSLGNRFYIPGRQFGPVTIEARNLTEATANLSRLFPSNFGAAISQMESGRVDEGFDENFTEPVATHTLSFPDIPDAKVSAKLDLNAMMPADKRGVFTVQVTPGNWENTQIVLWTNIGAIAHWKDDTCLLFVHDLHTLAPAPAAKVTLYSTKSQIMATVNTDDAGVARFTKLDNRLGRPRIATIETADDATFLDLTPRDDDNPPFDNNMTVYDPQGYDAYVYLDRNLYRPGEPIHARGIVRTKYVEAAANIPLLMRVQNPQNRLLLSVPVTTSDVGGVSLDIASEKSWLTGKYTVELCVPGRDDPIGTAFFNMEEFVPNRMKATLAVDKTVWKQDDPVAITLKAENLYGGAAANRKTDAVIILRPGSFKSEKFPGFVFRNDATLEPFVEKLGQQETNEQGETGYSFTYKSRENITMPLSASVRGMVFELGGREVRARADAVVFTAPVAVGMSMAPATDVKGVDVSVAAITADEAPADLPIVKVTLEKENWNYHVRTFSGRYEPSWSKDFETVETRDVPVQAGMGATRFDMSNSWGKYRVRVHSDATPLYSTGTFYCGWNKVELTSASSPTLIELTLNKPNYAMGDTCEMRIKSPFDGTAFVVLQCDDFKQTLSVPLLNNEGLASFPVTEEHFPNVWAEVTVVRKVDQEKTQVYPFSSFAMIDVPVADPRRNIAVTYPGLPAEVRPAQRVNFVVETRDSTGNPIAAEVTLAAVDEGIHTILEYANPDPFTHFQRARQAIFRRAHYYDKIAYDFEAAQIGGDALEKRLGKAPQIGDNWIKPVALWSGAVRTGANGQATVSFDVPEFNGQLRLVAVATGASATGAGAANLYVRRPYILQTTMPRFALAGDAFGCSANIINTTPEARRAVVCWHATGSLAGAGEQTIDLAPSGEAQVKAQFTAGAIGQGRLVWEVSVVNPADGAVLETLSQDAPLPVRPPAAWQSAMDMGVVMPGETKYFQNTTFHDTDDVELSITASANPLLRMQKGLRYLLRYPYGCVEQTTSSAMPLYLLRQQAALFHDVLPENIPASEETVRSYIQAGVNRLFSMQTVSGGLAYWPGDATPSPYGSIYAAHFLTLAFKDNAASISEKPFRSLQNYLRQIMNGRVGAVGYDMPDLYLRAYAIYVLALDGQLDAVEAIPRLDSYTMPESSRYLLAAALAINTGDMARVQQYLDTRPKKPYDDVHYSGVLNSPIRNTAIKLLAGVQMKRPLAELQPMADALVEWLQSETYYTTQQTAFVTTALGMYLSSLNSDISATQARILGPDGEKPLAGPDVYHAAAKGPGKVFTVINTGAAPVFINFASAGLPTQPRTDPVAEGGLRIERTICGDTGITLDPAAPCAHGGTYLIDVTLDTDQAKENVVLADLIPAGFEIANPRLDTDALAAMGRGGAQQAPAPDANAQDSGDGDETEGNESEGSDEGGDAQEQAPANAGITPSFLEVRDDRLILAFDTLPQGVHHFYYVVRAISPGTFRYPAAAAECMYNPAVRAATVDTSVTIE